jgi:hypothetical protein
MNIYIYMYIIHENCGKADKHTDVAVACCSRSEQTIRVENLSSKRMLASIAFLSFSLKSIGELLLGRLAVGGFVAYAGPTEAIRYAVRDFQLPVWLSPRSIIGESLNGLTQFAHHWTYGTGASCCARVQ